MPSHDDFLRAMAAAPFDDLPRLQYADWLDDRGDARAEWLRLEIAVCPHFRHVPEWPRFVELSATLPPEWLAAAGWYRWPLLASQIGRLREDKHLFVLREAVPGTKEYSSFANGEYFEASKSSGLCVRFNNAGGTDRLALLFFLGGGTEGYDVYPGPLPYGLTFDSTRADVEAALGPADAKAASTFPRRFLFDIGLHVVYCEPNPRDRNNPLRHVAVTAVG